MKALTSTDQVADYLKQFKDRFWPSGILAAESPARDAETKLGTAIVCKSKMIGSVPGNSDEFNLPVESMVSMTASRVCITLSHRHLSNFRPDDRLGTISQVMIKLDSG